MSPWGTEVDDDRFGLLLSSISRLAGGEWIAPNTWFKRGMTKAEKKAEQNQMIMAERARMNFRALSAAQEARAAQQKKPPSS
ncbi:hypothetical protein [Erythrobacter sp. R86502]|uniref:hypothetical protein n=1 Tax=Erythrobacter sp. R86502 TaxID=3093846 RepID=UPI0036D43411